MEQQHEEKTLGAYIKFLQTKGVEVDALALRTKFIKKLAILLKGKSGREAYGKALDTILKIEDKIERQQQLNIAREYYPFWMEDIKMIAAMSQSYGYDLSAAQLKPLPATLEWPSIEELNSEQFNEQENALLELYTANLQKQNLMEAAIQARIKLVKIVLLRLRDIPIQNNVAYRMAVEVTLPLFNLEDLRQRFLQAVREFFYIWIEKADLKYSTTTKPA